MELRFFIDTQLPPVLATVLVENGYDAIHTSHFENGHLLNDNQIRKFAIDDDRIIITKDKDFLDHYLLKGAPPKVLLVDIGNIKNKVLLKLIRANLSSLNKLFKVSTMVILHQDKLISY
ncbi:MAG: DUF5615 family PIN-like protein [Bacteroidota bacterium]|nr:DUF5615 family PIN-like protein [Bacteroidota bacterium]